MKRYPRDNFECKGIARLGLDFNSVDIPGLSDVQTFWTLEMHPTTQNAAGSCIFRELRKVIALLQRPEFNPAKIDDNLQ